MNLNIKELYEIKDLIDIHELFKKNIYNCFLYFDYIILDDDINEKDYKANIINKICGDKELINKIIEKIINEMVKIKGQFSFCEYIFQNNSFETQKDFIDILYSELKEEFYNFMSKIILNSEKLTILSSLTKKLPSCSKTICYNFLKDFDFDFSKEIEKYTGYNKINIFTKLNLPSFKSINFIKDIIEIDINNYINEYLREETRIRSFENPSVIILGVWVGNWENLKQKENLVDEFFMKENNNLNDPRFREIKKEIEKFFFVPNKQVIDYVKNFIIKDKFLRSFEGENK